MPEIKKKPMSSAYDIPADIKEADESLGDTSSVVNNPSIDLEGTVAPKVEAPPITQDESGPLADKEKQALARTFTGAAPALMGMLFGASPLTAEDQIVQGQKFYAGGVPKKMVTTVGPDGSPIYTDIREAAGEKVYQKPLRPSAAGLPKPTSFYNPESKQVEKGFADPISGKYFNAAGKEVPGAQEYVPTEFKEAVTAGGTKQFIPVSPVVGGQVGPAISGPPGEAASKNMFSQQYATALDLSKQYPKEIAPIQQKVNYANAALQTMASTDKDTQAQGALLAQQYLQDAKSNQNVINVVNPGMFDKWSEMATRIATGKASANEINALAAGVQQVAAAQKSSINAIGSATAQAAGPEAANIMSQNIYKSPSFTPQMPTIPASQHPQAKEAIEWANKNPNTEKAKEIYKRFGR